VTVTDQRSRRVARRQAGPGRLRSTSREVDPIDPIAVFAAASARGLEAALWLQPAADRSIVGVGRAWAVEEGGGDRFEASAHAWRSLLADGLVSSERRGPTEGGPILLGGLGFTGRTPEADDPWAAFGSASLVLPSLTVRRDGPASTLAIATTMGLGSDADPGELEGLWDALAGDADADADRASAPDVTGHPATSTTWPARRSVAVERPDRAEWDRTVGMFAGAVGRGRIDKVVLARRVTYRAPGDLDVIAALRHLAASAPESTTFAFVRDGTTFLGATPERLVQTRGRSFETVAIAGSAPRGSDPAEDARLARLLLASEKEREEHAVVVDTLRAGLSPIVETLQVADSPAILPLRHVQHLVTPITGTLRDEAGLLSLGGRLHPTPAVGGAPRELALELIADQEGFDRGWYAGPIGWLGADGDGELMVALRCGLVTGPEAILFAGCGIVADSDPAREWEESRLKLRTMTTALGGLAVGDR